MSHPYLLQCAIKDALAETVGTTLHTCRATGDKEELAPLKIFIGDIPPRKRNEPEAVPCLCIQEQGGKDIDGMTFVELVIRIVVYSREVEDAAHELSNLIFAVRHALMPFCTRPLSQRYRLLCSDKGELLPWERPLEQQSPYAEAFVLSVWDYKGFEHNFTTEFNHGV